MTLYYALLAAVLVSTAVAVAVYLIKTLIQVRRTAQELELLARKANGEMDKVGSVTSSMASLAGAVGGSSGRLAAGAFNLVLQMIQRYRRRRSEVDVPTGGES